MKKLLLLLLIPFNIYAYSPFIYVPAANIGIELKSKGIIISGLYKIGDISPAKEAGLEVGDMIVSIDDNDISTTKELQENIEAKEEVKIGYIRDNIKKYTKLKLIKESNIYKSGLYIKDSVLGTGTLTYIDPQTNIFGALGHEIDFNSNDGVLYESNVTSINPSSKGKAGSKEAKINKENIIGKISENTSKGIFGKYNMDSSNMDLYEVGTPLKGKAKVLTTLENNEVTSFDINIIKVTKDDTKNILFEITDKNLLLKTGGIIQGMSGSPIIQNNKIVGAVTHVIISTPSKGYGIFITKMLEEGEN